MMRASLAIILALAAALTPGVSFALEASDTMAAWKGASAEEKRALATMASLWLLAFVALVLIVHAFAVPALVAVVIGYAAIAVLDPIAARDGQAPLFFARLRPTQMLLAVAGLLALLANAWLHG